MAPPARARRPLSRLAAGAAAALLLLAGCTDAGPAQGGDGASDGGAPTGAAASDGGASAAGDDGPALQAVDASAAADLPGDPAEDPAYATYYDQQIEWGSCEDVYAEGVECGTLTVPLAWNDPGAGDIELAVARVKASGESQGSLVTNPGGPGLSGVNALDGLMYSISPAVTASYDVVGFDSRGVYRSEGITCLDDKDLDKYLSGTAEPSSEGTDDEPVDWAARAAEACEANSGDILPYLDTLSTARDMDVLRAALGEDQLDYLGYSYGTYLGSSYAELYPDRVGRFVLDGAVDPTLTRQQFGAGQAEGFERATEAFLADCLDAGSSCPFHGTEEEAKQQLLDLLAGIDAEPLSTTSVDRELTGAIARSAVLSLMYDDGQWELGREALTAAADGDGSLLLDYSDRSNERGFDGTYRTNSAFAMTAVSCLDRPGLADAEQAAEEAERIAEKYPTFGPVLGGDACAEWPVPPLREPAPITAKGAGPIVVIGTTGDPATPYAWAQNLSAQLDDAVLLTFEGNGHTAYGRSGGCIEKQVDTFLLEGIVPEDGMTC